jgi:hypothetical protein
MILSNRPMSSVRVDSMAVILLSILRKMIHEAFSITISIFATCITEQDLFETYLALSDTSVYGFASPFML